MGSIIAENLDKLHALGVMYIGIFSHIIDDENDIEVYIIPSQRNYNYFGVENLLSQIFPDFKVGIYDEGDRRMLGDSVIHGIQFI